MTKSFAEALGIEYTPEKESAKELVLISEERTQVSDTNIPDAGDIKEDYMLARKTFKDLISKGTTALNSLESVAKESETAREAARIAEVMSALMKTVSDTTKDMFALQKMTKELTGTDKKVESSVTIDKAVFVGTTAELLKKVKAEE